MYDTRIAIFWLKFYWGAILIIRTLTAVMKCGTYEYLSTFYNQYSRNLKKYLQGGDTYYQNIRRIKKKDFKLTNYFKKNSNVYDN